MRIVDLRNYGKGLMESTPDREAMVSMRQVGETVRSELRKALDVTGLKSLDTELHRIVQGAKGWEWATLRQHGLREQRCIDSIVQRIAMMKALIDLVGMDRAVEIQCRLLDKTMYELMAPMFPSIQDYRDCGDFFHAFKEYSKASYDANIRAGLHEMVIGEDTESVLAFNIESCAWHEVAKEFGDP